MDRRQFMSGVTATGTTGLAACGSSASRTVTCKIQGFTWVTCAVGLETMLRAEKGVVRVRASYPDRSVVTGFDDRRTSEKAIKTFIASCGFTVG